MPRQSVNTKPNTRARNTAIAAAAGLAAAAPTFAQAGAGELALYFGFDEKRIVVVHDDAGPYVTGDFNNDGLTDIAIANDANSRIEIHTQRSTPRTSEELARELEVNELPPSPWFDRHEIPVAHRIAAMQPIDLDGDGMLDILYAGIPAEVVALRQTSTMDFEMEGRRRLRNLRANQNAFAIGDVTGDPANELITNVGGEIHIFALDETGPIGEPRTLTADAQIAAFFLDDYDGSGTTDIMGVLLESESPLRLWLQEAANTGTDKDGIIGAERRFELPPLIEVETFRTPGRDAASVAVIERQSRRMVLYDLATEQIDERRLTAAGAGEREAVVELHSFKGGADRDRTVDLADINADGRPDLIATNTAANSVTLHLQRPDIGLGEGKPFSAFKDPKHVAAGQWDEDDELEVFVLSEEEGAVGVADFNTDTQRLSFPRPLSLATGGATPVAMTKVTPRTPFDGLTDPLPGDALAVVVRDRRDHTVEVHFPPFWNVEPRTIELEDVNRPPQSLLAGDFDRDGYSDLLLFTPGEPMVMVSNVLGEPDATDESRRPAVLTDDDMTNFGLVNAAGPTNVATLDIDNDGLEELLIADENFVRAAAFDRDSGWTVVDQITMPDPDARLTAVAAHTGRIVAADAQTERILVIEPNDQTDAWEVADKLRLTGVDITGLRLGPFDGTDAENILGLTEEAFAVIKTEGTRISLEEFASFRSENEDRLEHEIEAGDVNNDGFTDLVVLDNGENAVQIFTLSESRELLRAIEFKVFEARLFQGGGRGGFEPSNVILDDVTGDGLTDLIVEVHDRYIVYPQDATD